MELTLDQALQKGIEAHKAGKVEEADRYYTAILKAQPKHPDANHNMGALAVGVGKVEQALPFLKTALEANSNITQFWLSYIDALIKLDRMVDAKAVLDQAKSNGVKGDGFNQLEKRLGSLKEAPAVKEPTKNQLQALINLYTKGQHKEALNQASKLLTEFPNSVTLYNIVGVANQGLGNLDEAIEAYQKVISIKPQYPEAYYNLGNAFQNQGKLEEAIEAYNKAISLKLDYAEAFNNLGNALKQKGNLDKAIEAYIKAASIKPDYVNAHYNLGNALRSVIFKKPNKDLQRIIISILDKQKYVSPKHIANAAISLLKFEPNLQKHLQLVDNEVALSHLDVITDLSELPLLLKLMSVCPLPDLELEKLLKCIRCFLLSNILSLKDAPQKLLRFQSALALQCFTNEYIYNYTKEEEKACQTLEKTVKNAFKNNVQPTPQALLVLASYKSLNQYDWCNRIVLTDDIQEVFSRQVEEPNQEEILKQQFSIVGKITDNVSLEVRKQYEENPYPRWVNLGLDLKPMSISKVVDEVDIKLHHDEIYRIKAPKVLIAGCGTGQHSIETAARFKSSKVLAIDLSLSSLAYAKRKTEEFGIENIEYMQADILGLGKLNKQFDIIESGGVLHHMDSPMAGWKALTDCLKPGGLMYIGLYSELARQHIVKIRTEISQAGIGSSDLDMKSFRNMIMKSDKEHHKLIKNSVDFYSLSALRDLLFHVQEYRFTIPQIKDHFDELGLKFSGFQSNAIISHFKQTNTGEDDPYDLDKWQAHEEANPRAFAGMYQFWCQKVDNN